MSLFTISVLSTDGETLVKDITAVSTSQALASQRYAERYTRGLTGSEICDRYHFRFKNSPPIQGVKSDHETKNTTITRTSPAPRHDIGGVELRRAFG